MWAALTCTEEWKTGAAAADEPAAYACETALGSVYTDAFVDTLSWYACTTAASLGDVSHKLKATSESTVVPDAPPAQPASASSPEPKNVTADTSTGCPASTTGNDDRRRSLHAPAADSGKYRDHRGRC